MTLTTSPTLAVAAGVRLPLAAAITIGCALDATGDRLEGIQARLRKAHAQAIHWHACRRVEALSGARAALAALERDPGAAWTGWAGAVLEALQPGDVGADRRTTPISWPALPEHTAGASTGLAWVQRAAILSFRLATDPEAPRLRVGTAGLRAAAQDASDVWHLTRQLAAMSARHMGTVTAQRCAQGIEADALAHRARQRGA